MGKRLAGLRKTDNIGTLCVPALHGGALNWNDVTAMEPQTPEA